MNAYCLFCETDQCKLLAGAAEKLFHCRAIYPKQIQHTSAGNKTIVDVERDLLPGYIFLYLEDETIDLSKLKQLHGVIRCLRDGSYRYELTGADEEFALFLLEKNGVIGKTRVYQEGDRIFVCAGAFAGLQTEILKVDHRGSRMMIAIPFANQVVKTWVEYELVKPEE